VVLAACGAGEPRRPGNVLLITIDTLRADHLGAYGFPAAATPRLDELARRGTRFQRATASTPITLPSHASLLTALWPPSHGARSNGAFRVPPEVSTLAERLKALGWRTAAVVGGDVLSRSYGLDQGFDAYRDDVQAQMDLPGNGRRAAEVTDVALRLIGDGAGPWFVWAHYFDPHLPYAPPPPFDARFASSPYDGEVAYVDREVGRLLDGLAAAGVAGDTLVVVTADHGESLGEHGESTHGVFLYDATLHVPLLLKGPGAPAGLEVQDPARLVDVAPTLLDLIGGLAEPFGHGRSLVPLLRGEPLPEADAYLESLYGQVQFGWSPLIGLRTRALKYVRAPIPELYDLLDDPREERNLAGARVDDAAEMESRLRALEATLAPPSGEARRLPDAEERRRLASLGYLAAGGTPAVAEGAAVPDPKEQIEMMARVEEITRALGRGRADDAIAGLRALLAARPDSTFARLALADALAGEGRHAEANAEFAEMARRVPGDPQARLHFGISLLKEGRFADARDQFLAALAILPDLAPAEEKLGVALAQLGDLSAARGHLERAIALAPNLPEAHLNLGVLLLQLGDATLAEGHLRRALELRPNYPAARSHLARLLAATGRRTEAEEIQSNARPSPVRTPGALLTDRPLSGS